MDLAWVINGMAYYCLLTFSLYIFIIHFYYNYDQNRVNLICKEQRGTKYDLRSYRKIINFTLLQTTESLITFL